MAAGLTHADDKGTLSRRSFCPCGNACRKCLGLERLACVSTMREECRLSRQGEKKKWGGTKMVRAFLDDAGGREFRGL